MLHAHAKHCRAVVAAHRQPRQLDKSLILRRTRPVMKRLKSIGLGKSSKADNAARVSAQPPSANWPQVSPSPQHIASNGTQPQNPAADTYVNFSDDEIRAMEESALEYAIQQSQQQTERCLPAYIAKHIPSWQLCITHAPVHASMFIMCMHSVYTVS